jgi:hypothetical protein
VANAAVAGDHLGQQVDAALATLIVLVDCQPPLFPGGDLIERALESRSARVWPSLKSRPGSAECYDARTDPANAPDPANARQTAQTG